MGDFLGEKILKPIRSKQEIILLLLETLKLFENPEDDTVNEIGRINIHIDKMSRIFYITKEKYFSFLFPFSVEAQDGYYRFYDSMTEYELDDKLISLLISIFKQSRILENSLEKAMDFIIESAEEYEFRDLDKIWRLLFKLWYMEDGYIRYDYDPGRENADIHPLHHLDINYSTGATYKLGLRTSIKMEDFRNILDTRTNCSYLAI